MQPRTLDSSTPVASATLLFSALPQIDSLPDWEPARCVIGDVSYQTEKTLEGEDSSVTTRYTVTMYEQTNDEFQRVFVQRAIRKTYGSYAKDVALSYRHELASATVCFNPSTVTEAELTEKLALALVEVQNG